MRPQLTVIDFNSMDLEWKHTENTNSDNVRAVQMASECRRRVTAATQKIIQTIQNKATATADNAAAATLPAPTAPAVAASSWH